HIVDNVESAGRTARRHSSRPSYLPAIASANTKSKLPACCCRRNASPSSSTSLQARVRTERLSCHLLNTRVRVDANQRRIRIHSRQQPCHGDTAKVHSNAPILASEPMLKPSTAVRSTICCKRRGG